MFPPSTGRRNSIQANKAKDACILACVLLCSALPALADVGIGTEEPKARLHVVGEDAATGRDLRIEHLDPPVTDDVLRFVVTDQDGYFHAADPADWGLVTDPGTGAPAAADDDWRPSVPDTEMTINSAIFTNNRIGVGVTVPAYEVDIDGDLRATGSLFASNHVITHATFATSDQRFKRDIEDYHNGLEQVRAMQPKRFRYTVDAPVGATDRTFYGLIAQEAALVDPNLVQSFDFTPLRTAQNTSPAQPITDYLGVDSQRLIFTLISAVKALDAKDREIDALRQRLDALEARLPSAKTGPRTTLRQLADAFLTSSNIPLQPKEFF